MMICAEVLAQYHLRSETKFLNGDYRESRSYRAPTRRSVANYQESNRWEERCFVGDDDDEEVDIEYGIDERTGALDEAIRGLSEKLGQWAAARLGISRTALGRALKLGGNAMSRSIRAQIRGRLGCRE